jgi:hypothetical protein
MESDSGLVFRSTALRSAVNGSDLKHRPTEIVYLLGLESSATPDPQWGFWQRALNTLVRRFQPHPVLSHVELFLPTSQHGGEVHFSTYYGRHAGWGSDFGTGEPFYGGWNENKWIAIPIVGAAAIERLRKECALEANVDTPYSLTGYLFSVPPLRALASARDNGVGDPAHCAALSARVLSRALPAISLPYSDAWYGPSTLFLELSKKARMTAYHEHISETTPSTLSLPEETERTVARETLLSGSNDSVAALSTHACNVAVEYQAHLVIKERATGGDTARMRVLEKGLGRMLVRWSLCQNELK